MRYLFGTSLVIWGLVCMFVLPDALPNKFMNYVILGTYILAVTWWLYLVHPWWVGYWVFAFGITAVVTFGDLSIKM